MIAGNCPGTGVVAAVCAGTAPTGSVDSAAPARMRSCRPRSSGPGSIASSPTSTRRAPWVDLQCLGAPPSAGQDAHELGMWAFAQRVARDQVVQLRDELLVPVQVHLGINVILGGLDPQPVKTWKLSLAQQV